MRGWINPRWRSRLYAVIPDTRHTKRYYRSTVRRVTQIMWMTAAGWWIGNEEFVVGFGCFGGMWLCRHFSREIFEKNQVVTELRKVLSIGVVGVERCLVAVLRGIFEVVRVRELCVTMGDIECEIFLMRYDVEI
jgi:hypothetical protein